MLYTIHPTCHKAQNRMQILYRYIVDGATINTHPPNSILFGHKKHWYSIRAHTLTNISLHYQLIYLPLKLLRLLEIASIGWTIRNRSSKYKVNLMFNFFTRVSLATLEQLPPSIMIRFSLVIRPKQGWIRILVSNFLPSSFTLLSITPNPIVGWS